MVIFARPPDDFVAGHCGSKPAGPQRNISVPVLGIVAIDPISGRRQENNGAVTHAVNGQVIHNKGLRVEIPVDRPGEQLSELGGLYFLRIERPLARIHAGPVIVVPVR